MNKCSALAGPHLMTRVSETGAGLGVKSTCKSWDACYLHGSWKRSSCKYHGSINPRFSPLCLHRLCNVQVCCVTNLANRNVCAENCFFFFFLNGAVLLWTIFSCSLKKLTYASDGNLNIYVYPLWPRLYYVNM